MPNKTFLDLTKNQIKKIQFIAKNNDGSISSVKFREILQCSHADKASKKSRVPRKFEFSCTLSKQDNDKILVTFIGRHYSKNDISSWPRRKVFAYKTSIKDAFEIGVLANKNAIPTEPLKQVTLDIVVFNPKSRDDDNNYDTLKIMRDCCTNYGIIQDDNRSVILELRVTEHLSKEYRVEILISRLDE